MKKSLLAIVAILSALPFISNAQWTTSGSNTYFNLSGNVGIGTTSPVGKLELNDGNGTGVIAYFGSNGTANAKGLYFSRPSVNTNPVNIQGTMSGVGATHISLQAEGGYVGIGTTSPNAKLHVQGSLAGGVQTQIINTSESDGAYASLYLKTGTQTGFEFYKYNAANSTYPNGAGLNNYDNGPIFISTGNAPRLLITGSGNVGIGTTSPNYKLVVNDISNDGHGYLGFSYSTTDAFKIGRNNTTGNLDFTSLNGTNNYGYIFLNGNVGIGTTTPIGKFDLRGNAFIGTSDLAIGAAGSFVQIDQGASTGNTYTQIRAYSNGGTVTNNLILQNSGGKVGIGTTIPDQLLTVKGTIHSQEVKVDLSVPGPDYVFEPTYKLPSLAEVKAFINKNHHLSEIPSAAEMAKNGLDLGDMNVKLLKKVEELTLHLIDKEEELKDQREKLNKMQLQINALIEKTSK
jgi:hypothetical protein